MNRNYPQSNLKPEAILEQAIALDGVGKANDALAVMKPIYIMRGKPVTRPWVQSLEDVTLKYVELCVKQKVPTSDVRNALTTFRASSINSNAATTQHPQSLIRVIKHLLSCAEKTVNFQALNVADNDDEGEDSPDSFARFVETEANTASTANVQEQQRKNRAMTALRTYWDYYRIALDVIRPQYRSQSTSATPPPAYYPLFRQLYEDILRQAFENCGTYRLPGDFRRLTWRLRSMDYKTQASTLPELIERRDATQAALNSTLPHDYDQASEQYSMILQTKFTQLNVALSLQSWAETSAAFSEITDILASVDDPRVLTSVTVILIQQRFLDFLWQGSNAFLHASALKALFDRLTQAQALYGGDNANYIEDLLKQAQAKATELQFPANSWAFASLPAIQNGLILSVILAQGASSQSASVSGNLNGQHGSRLFGGVSCCPADYPFSPADASNYYITSNSETSLQSLFSHAAGVAAANNVALTQSKSNFSVDPSFVPTTQTTTSNIEVFRYNALLAYNPGDEPTVANLMAFIQQFVKLQDTDSTTYKIFQLFTHLTNKTLTPLRLNRLIAPHLKLIKDDEILAQYEKQLYTTIVVTLLTSLSNMYSVISFAKFLSLLPASPFPEETAKLQLEAIITSASVQNNLSVIIDQGSQTLRLKPFPQQVEQRLFSVLGSTTAAFENVIRPALQPTQQMDQESLTEFFSRVRTGVESDVTALRERYNSHQKKLKAKEEEAKALAERTELAAKERAEAARRDQEQKLEEIKRKREQELQKKIEEESKAAKLQQIQDLVTKNAKEAEAKQVVLTKDMKKQLAKISATTPGTEVTEADLFELAKKVELQKKRELLRLRQEQKKTVDYTVRALRLTQREALLENRNTEMAEAQRKIEAQRAEKTAAHRAEWEAKSAAKKRTAHIIDAHANYKAKIMEERRQQYAAELAVWEQQQAELAAEQRQREAEEALLAEERKAREQQEKQEREAAENDKRANFRATGEGYHDAKPNKFSSSGASAAPKSKFHSSTNNTNKWAADAIAKSQRQ